MDYEWHSGAWIDLLRLSIPANVPEAEDSEYRSRLEEYVDRCAMVLEDWDRRDAQFLGEFRWGWVPEYEGQFAFLCLDVEGFPDLRLFVWINDFGFGGVRAVYVVAVHANGGAFLEEHRIDTLTRRRDGIIAQLGGGP